jgi:hypothetical protein
LSKHKRAVNPNSLRNLPQYKELSDEEFLEVIESREEEYETSSLSESFEERIQEKIEELTEDYDLSDMKSNDLLQLRALAQGLLSLEDFELLAHKERQNLTTENLIKIDKMQKIISDLRGDISKIQTDLKISRKVRKSDDREDVIQTVLSLKEKAEQFYKQKMAYIICPKCNMLLATIWVQYPEVDNELTFVCNRRKGGKEPKVLCNHKFTVGTKDLWKDKEASNKPEVLPESIA